MYVLGNWFVLRFVRVSLRSRWTIINFLIISVVSFYDLWGTYLISIRQLISRTTIVIPLCMRVLCHYDNGCLCFAFFLLSLRIRFWTRVKKKKSRMESWFNTNRVEHNPFWSRPLFIMLAVFGDSFGAVKTPYHSSETSWTNAFHLFIFVTVLKASVI